MKEVGEMAESEDKPLTKISRLKKMNIYERDNMRKVKYDNQKQNKWAMSLPEIGNCGGVEKVIFIWYKYYQLLGPTLSMET